MTCKRSSSQCVDLASNTDLFHGTILSLVHGNSQFQNVAWDVSMPPLESRIGVLKSDRPQRTDNELLPTPLSELSVCSKGRAPQVPWQAIRNFLNSPMHTTLPATTPNARKVAHKLITSYAEELEHLRSGNDHIPAVHRHMALPNDAEHLLWE